MVNERNIGTLLNLLSHQVNIACLIIRRIEQFILNVLVRNNIVINGSTEVSSKLLKAFLNIVADISCYNAVKAAASCL